MRRYLIVANDTMLGEPLLDEVRRRVADAAGDCALHLVVPASHGHGVWSEGQSRSAAAVRLQEAVARYGELDTSGVTGEVGDPSPVLAVGDAIIAADHRGERAFDEVVVSTHARRISRWLSQDVIHRLQRAHPGLAITHVESVAATVAGS